MYDVIIVGSGFAGTILANKFAEKGKKVLILEKRNHTGGNAFEEYRKNGIRVHKYGPHIFHTNSDLVYKIFRENCELYFYEHKVLGSIDNKLVPIPFNFKSIEILFSKEKADEIKINIEKEFSGLEKASIMDLINSKNQVISEFGKFVFDKVFVNYTAKQWNMSIEKVDTSVINRVPVLFNYDDRYFQDKYQYMPKNGYNEFFTNLLKSDNITINLGVEANKFLEFYDDKIFYEKKEFNGILIYTGALDELFSYKFGSLPYRSLELVFEDYENNYYQPSSVVNYPNTEKYTRITEFKYFDNDIHDQTTTILKEYPLDYNHNDSNTIPYYAIINDENSSLYDKYFAETKKYKNFFVCGRLAEYKYYNMDAVIIRALDVFEEIERGN